MTTKSDQSQSQSQTQSQSQSQSDGNVNLNNLIKTAKATDMEVSSNAANESAAAAAAAALSTAFSMNSLQHAANWPFLAAAAGAGAGAGAGGPNANAFLQYAKLAFPDFDQSAAAAAAAAASSNEPQSPSRVPLVPPFAVPPSMFVGGPPSLVPQFGPMPPAALLQPSVAETGPLMLPPGTQLDSSTLAAITAAAAAYQQMNASGTMCQFDFPGGARRKNATRETTSTLKAWLHEHRKNPYPTKAEKIMLAILTRMSLTQVSTWFANARRRLKKESKMNSWAASQQQSRSADGSGSHVIGAKRTPSGDDDSDNSACDDNDNMDFDPDADPDADADADSIDIDGECVSDLRHVACGKRHDGPDSSHADCRQCLSRPTDGAIDVSDQHRAPLSNAVPIGMAAEGPSVSSASSSTRTASNNNHSHNQNHNYNHSYNHAQMTSTLTGDKSHRPVLSTPEIDAALVRQTLFGNTNKLLMAAAATNGNSESRSVTSPDQFGNNGEKNKFWSLVDTATNVAQAQAQAKQLPMIAQPTRLPEPAVPASASTANADLQNNQMQEFLRNLLTFSAKMQAAAVGASGNDQQAAANGGFNPFAPAEMVLPAELLAHTHGAAAAAAASANAQNEAFANAAALYLNMMKQKALV